MTKLWLATVLATLGAGLTGLPALAEQAIGSPDTAVGKSSLVVIDCKGCPPPKDPDTVGGYIVQDLPSGTQRVEIRQVDGKRKLVRTEAWMGGSPVVFFNTLPEDAAQELDAASAQPMPGAEPMEMKAEAKPIEIDQNTTSAVSATMDQPVAAEPKAFDPGGLELRLTQ